MHFLNFFSTQIILFSTLLRIINAIDANIVINITSSKIAEIENYGIEREKNKINELTNDCFAYEFISRSYPIVFEQCFIDIFNKYIIEHPEHYVGKNFDTFIIQNITRFSYFIREKLLIYAKNYKYYFETHENINFRLLREINTLMSKEFSKENEYEVIISNKGMLFYIIYNMTNKIIYKGLHTLFDLIPNKKLLFQNQISIGILALNVIKPYFMKLSNSVINALILI